uniref:Putative secreted protein n=1 Tax=Amblyomma triste TaxID=251400 RepID=A0A023G0U7_AMBTT
MICAAYIAGFLLLLAVSVEIENKYCNGDKYSHKPGLKYTQKMHTKCKTKNLLHAELAVAGSKCGESSTSSLPLHQGMFSVALAKFMPSRLSLLSREKKPSRGACLNPSGPLPPGFKLPILRNLRLPRGR